MPEYVRAVGEVAGIQVGVDHGLVTMQSFAPVRFAAGQREELDRLLYEADRQAAEDAALLSLQPGLIISLVQELRAELAAAVQMGP